MKYNIIVKNRFTGKIYETHENKGIGAVFEVQDVYMLMPWVIGNLQRLCSLRALPLV